MVMGVTLGVSMTFGGSGDVDWPDDRAPGVRSRP
jgi:hypothetical protein